MKLSVRIAVQLLTLAATSVIASFSAEGAQASTFGEQEVNQSNFVLLAAPIGASGVHQLVILEQISASKQCWDESGSQPVVVDPLLVKFDFTGLCSRSTDSNGYSIRRAGKDLGARYLLKIHKTDSDMVLMGIPDFKRNGDQDIELGRSNGITNGFAKIELDPDWRLTRRTYGDKALGHIYISK